MLLAKHEYFLRVFELGGKFCHLTLKNPKKQNIIRQLSSCIDEKYIRFQIISNEYSKKLTPIDIIYKLQSHQKKNFLLLLTRYIKVLQKFLLRQ